LDRRHFLLATTVATAATVTAAASVAATDTGAAPAPLGAAGASPATARNGAYPAAATVPLTAAVPASAPVPTGDPLNPPGIQVAGIRMLPVVNGKYKVWTKRIGQGPLKVLVLHGGPGFSHEYLEALESFLPPAGIEMYYYDQLGCNNSDQPQDSSLWTLERYVEEVEAVRMRLVCCED